ncbi:MAG TPA: phytanoyl-CoA dioxygenase family protein [Abditibacterium sp.]|jgi:ectoine hydroxylase-related dioxygenase (phytanoyl-CoA dioxygenase family)
MKTLDSLISEAQKREFDELGYCIVPGLFSESQIQDIEAFFEEYKLRGNAVFDGGTTFQEIDASQRQVRAMNPHRYSQQALEWLINPNVASVLEELLHKPALAAQTMYYFKPPGAKGQGMHQDNFYLVSQPATCIAAWTAIDDSNLENGCLYVVPGSHRGNILCPSERSKERWFNYGDSHIGQFPRDQKPIPVAVPRGSTMFFGGNLIHGSGPNRTTDRWRRTFIGHYIDEASEQVAKFYHPVLNMRGEVVSSVEEYHGGGPCGDGWGGAEH